MDLLQTEHEEGAHGPFHQGRSKIGLTRRDERGPEPVARRRVVRRRIVLAAGLTLAWHLTNTLDRPTTDAAKCAATERRPEIAWKRMSLSLPPFPVTANGSIP